jgi:lysyl-tRNA synthetase, class II
MRCIMENKRLDAEQHPVEQVLSEHEVRLEKVRVLRERGYEPWPAKREVTATCRQVIDQYAEGSEHVYAIAGRVMTMRDHGKTMFAHIQDRSGQVQLYVKHDVVGEQQFAFFKDMIDVGDIVWCHGVSFKTKKGEITLRVDECALLSKCIHPLPEKFHGIADQEIKYRQRYLDLITSSETRARFIARSHIVSSLRRHLDSHDFIEVETPMLHPIPGGAAARPFVTHHNALDSDFYLRIAPELYLKRLVVGGFERVYEINRNFRNEGVSTRHNPEFTMLEYYMAHEDYHFAMDFLEEMIRKTVKDTCGTLCVTYGDEVLDFEKRFERLSVYEAVKRIGKCTEQQLTSENIDRTLEQYNVTLNNVHPSYGEKLFALFEERVEQHILQPTFIIDYPIEISPLAKRDAQDPTIAARFELFVARFELANGFNELNDPIDQAERFKAQVEMREGGDAEAHHFDEDYVRALEYGLPPAVGVGLGIDRLTMVLTNTQSIKEVILFPTLKKK